MHSLLVNLQIICSGGLGWISLTATAYFHYFSSDSSFLSTKLRKFFHETAYFIGSISAALSCPVYVPPGVERGLLSRTAAGN